MKTLIYFIGVIHLSLINAQNRVTLYEEFTGEDCVPCAAYNPALDALLSQSAIAAKIIPIKWQVDIPTAPFNSASLYQTNKAENEWRRNAATAGGYGYQYQYTPSSILQDGIKNAPTCMIDGQNQWPFGTTSNHVYYTSSAVINSAAAIPTPFSIQMSPSWNSSFNNCMVTVTVSSSSAFTAMGALMLRLCLVERRIEFQNAPGSNGEKIFHDVVRKSYPTTSSGGQITSMGTVLPSSWTQGQTQVLNISCAIPSYIMDLSQMAFVAFVQDDGNQKVYQAARSNQPAIPNDASAGVTNIPFVTCTTTLLPTVTIKNNGPTAITALTIIPKLDGITGSNISWSGSLAGLSSTTIPLNVVSVSAGTHTFAYSISNVSGGDIIMGNNQHETVFSNASSFFPAPLNEDFEGNTFPPLNWLLSNTGGPNTFEKISNVGGYGQSVSSAMFLLTTALAGETDEMYMPPVDLSGTTNPELSFDLAYQTKQGAMDSLFIFLSPNCGNSWVKIYGNGGTTMTTAPTAGGTTFTPLSSEWKTIKIPLLSYTSSQKIHLKFKIKTDAGNGLFIDNVNVKSGSGPTDIYRSSENNTRFTVYPNPAMNHFKIFIDLSEPVDAIIEMQNTLGQVVLSSQLKLSQGAHEYDFKLNDLDEGIYFINLKTKNWTKTKKILLTN